ncbi:hypothetical protein KY495_05490 [Massilia sp. PAMC28688]|uniref:PIN domain-containing protein n=1 Tax=Massilia sp. PAMC28688 TaxID=2861283 RepID=UPI001C63000A|nr:PIN domain-containing protein [Massilia sp. PAMC28688]QYF94650.1 hypothetical protein KY495_05490 [Massilia sp. PAMC28688]
MIVYVESNFVLELALLQDDSEPCERILQLAERGVIKIAIPAFSLGEPYETLVRRHRERRVLALAVAKEMNQLARSTPYRERENADALLGVLNESVVQETERLNAVLSRLVDMATILPTDRDVMRNAIKAQNDLDLSPQDAIVYAAVLHNVIIEKEVKCFLNKNVKDFLIPEIVAGFAARNCKLLGKFAAGLAHISAHIAKAAPTNDTPPTPGD